MQNDIPVRTLSEIQAAIDHLSVKEKSALWMWMSSQTEKMMPEEERALVESLDRAASQLDAGTGIDLTRVREQIKRWSSKEF